MATEARVTELINRWLGGKPFVLIQLDGRSTGPGEDDFEVVMTMDYGGGVGKSGAMGTLAEMLGQNGWTVTPPEGFDPDADD